MKIEKNIELNESFRQNQMINKEIAQGESFKLEKDGDIREIDHKDYMRNFESNAMDKPLYRDNSERMRLIQKQIYPVLKGVAGFKQVLERTLSKNPDSARGFLAELVNARRAHRAGLEVLEMDKTAFSDAGEKTDIDLYAKTPGGNYIVIENKDCRSGISLTEDFKREIDLTMKTLVDNNGKIIRKDASVYLNNGPITDNAKQYAKERNVHIKENMNGRARERYYKNLINMYDSKQNK